MTVEALEKRTERSEQDLVDVSTDAQQVEWFFLDASTTRLFRLGERVRKGERLGVGLGDWVFVVPRFDGHIVDIQYDIGRDEVILAVARPSEGKAA